MRIGVLEDIAQGRTNSDFHENGCDGIDNYEDVDDGMNVGDFYESEASLSFQPHRFRPSSENTHLYRKGKSHN